MSPVTPAPEAPAPGATPAPGARQATGATEAPLTLTEPAPRTLGLLDQLGFWGNLGVSLLGFAGAAAVLTPVGAAPLSLPAAAAAIVVGTLAGAAVLAASLVTGASTGAPAMVVLRGLLGARASWLPTALNLAQCLGWAVFELVVIGEALRTATGDRVPRWACVVVAGLVTIGFAARPLGAIRVIRRYVTVLVVLALLVLAAGLLRRPSASTGGSWHGFWLAVDAAVAIPISWVPLGADYSRHARTARSAFTAGLAGFGLTQIMGLGMGVVALAQVQQRPEEIFGLFRGLPLGALAFGVLVLRETDLSFANVYSTAVSVQNLAPGWDRRVLSTAIGALATAAALSIDIGAYTNFLYLIGGVFIPLSGALLGAWWRTGGRSWDTSARARLRPGALGAWAAGFVAYQLINPGATPGWSGWWQAASDRLHLAGHAWLSASLVAFTLAAALAALTARPTRPA